MAQSKQQGKGVIEIRPEEIDDFDLQVKRVERDGVPSVQTETGHLWSAPSRRTDGQSESAFRWPYCRDDGCAR